MPGRSLDKYRLYELAVTSPLRTARFFRAVHGVDPRTVREDFAGTAALARGWLALDAAHRAIAVDSDATVLARAGIRPRLRLRAANVLAARDRADIIAATNFPIGYWHTRPELLAYLRHARRCLHRAGVFVCDTYGGRSAFTPGATRVRVTPERGAAFEYVWEQRAADPATARVLNAIHFRARTARGAKTIRDAFVYDWRLWSIPELRDAMLEAGFSGVEVYHELGDAIDSDGHVHVRPLEDPRELPEDWVVYVAARR